MNHVIVGGAKSSEIKPRYDQIPANSLRRVAIRFSEGNKNYDGPEADTIGGPMNWQGGDATFFCERFNHLIEHLNHWKEAREKGYETADDDLAAAAWGCFVLMWAEDNHRL